MPVPLRPGILSMRPHRIDDSSTYFFAHTDELQPSLVGSEQLHGPDSMTTPRANTHRAAAPRTLVEAKSSASRDEVFLSPHVIDRVAFEDYAQRLRLFIDEADSAAQALRISTGEALSVKDELIAGSREQSERLQAAAKVLRAIAGMENRISAGRPDAKHQPAPAPADAAESAVPADAMERLLARAQRQLTVSVQSAVREIERRGRETTLALDEHRIALDARAAELARREQIIDEAHRRANETAASLRAQGQSLAALYQRALVAIDEIERNRTEADHCRAEPAVTEDSLGVMRDFASLLKQAGEIRTAVSSAIVELSELLDRVQERQKKLTSVVRNAVVASVQAEEIAHRAHDLAQRTAAQNTPGGESPIPPTQLCRESSIPPSGSSSPDRSASMNSPLSSC